MRQVGSNFISVLVFLGASGASFKAKYITSFVGVEFDVLFDFSCVELPKREEEEEVTPEPEVRKTL